MSKEEGVKDNKKSITKWRVKLYELSTGGQWSDSGTGFTYIEEKPEPSLVMQVTNRKGELYKFTINKDTVFSLQNKTILTWRKGDRETKGDDDTAISFQEREGINEIWKFICDYTGKSELSDDSSIGDDNIIEALFDVSRTSLPFIAKEIREVSESINDY